MRLSLFLILFLATCLPCGYAQTPKNLISVGWQGYSFFDGTGYVFSRREPFTLGITSFSYQRMLKGRWFVEGTFDGYDDLRLGVRKEIPKVVLASVSHRGLRIGHYFYQKNRLSLGAATGLTFHNEHKSVQVTDRGCFDCFDDLLIGHRKGLSSIPIIGKAQIRLHKQLYLSGYAGYFFGIKAYTVEGYSPVGATVPINIVSPKFWTKDAFSCDVSIGIGFDRNVIRSLGFRKKRKNAPTPDIDTKSQR